MTDTQTESPEGLTSEGADLRVCGEDVLISRSLGKLESGRHALRTLRSELTAIKRNGGRVSSGRISVLLGFSNSALTALNDLSWRLQLRSNAKDQKMLSDLIIADEKSLRSNSQKKALTEEMLAELSREMLVAQYKDILVRRRILAEEFNQISDHAIALQRSRFYKLSRLFSKTSTTRIDEMVDIACAQNRAGE